MKKVLLLTAAVLTLWASPPAMAKTKTASISFVGGCDGMDIIVNTTTHVALETGNGCDEGAHYGAGTIGDVKGFGKAITFGINLYGKGGGAYQYIFVISYPLVSGASWKNFYTQDGKTYTPQYSGTYTVNDPRSPRTKAAGHAVVRVR